MEIEIKYQNGKNCAEKVLKNAQISPFIGQKRCIKMIAIYYDTPNGDFSHAKLAMRLRQEGNSSICALKGGKMENGLARRLEIEVEALSIDEGWQKISSSAEFAAVLAILPQNSPLLCGAPAFVETARMDFLRTAWDYVRGGLHCELAQDIGNIYAGTRAASIDEFEIELKRGQEHDFLAFIAKIERDVALVRGNKSKYRRALDLMHTDNA